jgi:hypothetical protein
MLEGRPVAAGKPDCKTPGRELAPTLISESSELSTPDGRPEAPGRPDDTPPGMDVAPALICDSRELMTPVCRTGRLTPEGRPDGKMTPEIEDAPALMFETTELTAPDGGFETAGMLEARPGIEVTPALICDNKELTTPVGRAVTGRLTPPVRSDITPGTDVAPALIWDSRELTMPVGRAVTPGKPDCRPPGRDEAAALMSERRELTTLDGSAVTGKLTPLDRPDGTMTPGIDVAPALI